MPSKKQVESKVTAINETQDLKIPKLDNLVGKLLTYEIHLQKETKQPTPV